MYSEVTRGVIILDCKGYYMVSEEKSKKSYTRETGK